ncbi:MAG: alpha-L-fucosidase [Planctomycetota bacterium]
MTFKPTWDSLQQYACPDWFRDAKFGIWAHWGPQGVPMAGDWYARNMYIEGDPAYEHHLKHFGHLSEFGYKDILPLWTCENFDAQALVNKYKAAGAKYFVSMGVHHDNYDLWNSKHHKYNAVNIGPKRDIVGEFRDATRSAGLHFGVTEHLERAYNWFNTNKGSDKKGPKAGVPYDGNIAEFEDFYFPPHDDTNYQYPLDPPEWWTQLWLDRINDLVEQYDPDLLYTDGAIPFGEVGRSMLAHFYNRNLERRGGKLEAVYNLKSYRKSVQEGAKGKPSVDKDGNRLGGHGDYIEGIGVLDLERGGVDTIWPEPWQTDTCVGGWYYKQGLTYKSPQLIVHMLADIVSKNGNLLLNFPGQTDGTIDDECHAILDSLAAWFAVNGEAIYGTRPWHTYGQGQDFPTGDFAEPDQSPLGEGDYRFVTKGGNTLYAIAMGWPASGTFHLTTLKDERVANVELLGHAGPLEWSQDDSGVKIKAPDADVSDLAYSLKIRLA